MNGSGVVVVTGAGGFVGAAVVRVLVAAMRERTAPPVFADGSRLTHVVALLRPEGADTRLRDITPGPEWSVRRAALGQPDAAAVLASVRPRAVLHLALDARCHDEQGTEPLRALVEPPLAQLFEALRGVPGAHVVSTGSVAVVVPGARLDENAPMGANPGYPHYARAKLIEEAAIEQLGAHTGVRWTHLRLFYLFGRHESPRRLLPYLVWALRHGEPAHLSSGTQVRDYTDVDEVAVAYLRALAAPLSLGNRKYHIGSGHGITVREFASSVATVVGRPELLHFGSGPVADEQGSVIVAEPTRAREELGWSASEPLARLKQAAAWYMGAG